MAYQGGAPLLSGEQARARAQAVGIANKRAGESKTLAMSGGRENANQQIKQTRRQAWLSM